MVRPKLLVARATFPAVLDKLATHFDLYPNQDDVVYSQGQLLENLQGCQAAFTSCSERIDAELMAACPQLKIVANVAVGYNNLDVDACTAAGVLCTNAPDVLTDTTADMGFALLMTTARRVSEGENFLRSGDWKRFSYNLLTGADVYGSTPGILGPLVCDHPRRSTHRSLL